MSITETTVDFLRHGEVLGKTCFRGITDDPLAEAGWQQMFRQCQGRQWQLVMTSPLRRCLSFASAWGQEQNTEVVIDEHWREIDFGEWEGRNADEINQTDSDALTRYYADPSEYTPPGAEAYSQFSLRVGIAWESLLRNHAGQNILVVTHAGVIRHLFARFLQLPHRKSFQIEVPHACLTRFSCYDDTEAGRFIQLNFHLPL